MNTDTMTRLWRFDTKAGSWKAEIEAAIAAWEKRGVGTPVLLEINLDDVDKVEDAPIHIRRSTKVAKRHGMFHFKGGD